MVAPAAGSPRSVQLEPPLVEYSTLLILVTTATTLASSGAIATALTLTPKGKEIDSIKLVQFAPPLVDL